MKEFNKESLLKFIKEEIDRSSKETIEEIEKEIEHINKKEIERLEEEIKETYELEYRSKMDDLKVQHTVDISKEKNVHMRFLFETREEYAQKVFLLVKEKLIEYTKTKEYENQMIHSMKEYLIGKKGYTLHINENDYVLEKESENIDGISSVVKDATITIGGYVLIKDTQYYDETLDTRFEEQKEWFYQNSNFILE